MKSTLLLSLFLSASFNVNANIDTIEAFKKNGLIWGSIYGDAFGGPYEFQIPKLHPLIKKNRALTRAEWKRLSKSVKLVPYKLKKSPYGIWQDNAPVGTITDDTRHKVLYWLSKSKTTGTVTKKSLAKTYTLYSEKDEGMYKQWLSEYSKSAWYVLNPNHPNAYPLERLWGGISTQAGQMIFLLTPLENPGNSKDTYINTYKLNFFDQGPAKDFTSSLVGALSYALKESSTWEGFKKSIIKNDPYDYAKIPYVKREVNQCLKMAIEIVDRAKGNPQSLYKMLEEKLNAKTWWEAHVSFTVSIAFLEMAYRYNEPMSAFALARSFGHDTDSYAQVIGAVIGSLEGVEAFDSNEIGIIKQRVQDSFGDIFQ